MSASLLTFDMLVKLAYNRCTEMRAAVPTLKHVIVARGELPAGMADAHDMQAMIDAQPLAEAQAFVQNQDRDPLQVGVFQLSGGSTGIQKIIPRFNYEYVYQFRKVAEFNGYDTSLHEARLQNLFDLLGNIFPESTPYINESTTKKWTGLRPLSASGVPIVSQTNVSNLYLNTGHGTLGWTTAAASGKALSDLMCGKAAGIELSDYSL